MSNSLLQSQGQYFVRPDLGLNRLQELSSDKVLKAKRYINFILQSAKVILIHVCLHVMTYFFIFLSRHLHLTKSALKFSFSTGFLMMGLQYKTSK